jgi:GTP diphosphokinase / guanosine-3',5'-bis(diphosphate) 3'-diphosphatase
LEAATLVAEATEGKDPDLVVAALLHYAIEDGEVPKKLIAQTFGADVADLVAEVTDDKTLEKGERKKRQGGRGFESLLRHQRLSNRNWMGTVQERRRV